MLNKNARQLSRGKAEDMSWSFWMHWSSGWWVLIAIAYCLFWLAPVADWASTPNSSFQTIGHRKGTIGFILFFFAFIGPVVGILYLFAERPQLLKLP
jgi:cytochrome b561